MVCSDVRSSFIAAIALLPLALTSRCGPWAAPEPINRAIVVCISDYSRGTNPLDKFGDLKTKKDAENMSAVLTSLGGFKKSEIVPLIDEGATKAAILAQLDALSTAPPGSRIVFYFSGHGHYVRDTSVPPEDDGKDEVLVTWLTPTDKANTNVDERKQKMYLLDDELNDRLTKIVSSMSAGGTFKGHVAVILDSCHSGTGSRGDEQLKGRNWDERLDGPEPPPVVVQADSPSGWLEGSKKNLVFLAACKASQRAGVSSEGEMSIFTKYLTRALENLRSSRTTDITYRDAIEWTNAQALSESAGQDAQVEGDADSPLFGQSTATPRPGYALVSVAQAGPPPQVRVEEGEAHGITKGSTYEIFKAGSNFAPADKIASGTVSATDAFGCTVDLTGFTVPADIDAFFSGARARIKTLRYEGQQLTLSMPQDSPLKPFLADLRYVSIVAPGKPANLQLVDNATTWRFRRLDNTILEAPRNEIDALKALLLTEWQWRRIVGIRPSPAGSPVVTLSMYKIVNGQPSSTQPPRGSNGAYVLEPSSQYEIRCKNAADSTIYAVLLRRSKQIEVFPQGDVGKEVPRGATVTLMRFNTPAGTGSWHFKFFGTDTPVDFRILMRGPSVVRAGDSSPFESLLQSVDGQAAMRGDLPIDLQWASQDFLFELPSR